jgi:hypothetical protein
MSGSPGEFVELSLLKEARDQRAGELRGTTRPPARPQAGMLAEHVASPPTPTDFIESVLSAPEVRAAAARAAVEPKLETLRARIAAARRRLEAKQQEYGTKLNALAHRDYAKLHVLLGGSLAMELKDKVDEVRGVFEGRVRAGGTIVDPSVFATLDRTLRLIAEVKAQDLHRCPPPRRPAAVRSAELLRSLSRPRRGPRRSWPGWTGFTTWKRGLPPRSRPATSTGPRSCRRRARAPRRSPGARRRRPSATSTRARRTPPS